MCSELQNGQLQNSPTVKKQNLTTAAHTPPFGRSTAASETVEVDPTIATERTCPTAISAALARASVPHVPGVSVPGAGL